MSDEHARRNAATVKILALLETHPYRWLHWRRFERFSACAWRTRLSDARKQIQKAGGELVWNKRVRRSAYMFKPQAGLGRDATHPQPDRWDGRQRSMF